MSERDDMKAVITEVVNKITGYLEWDEFDYAIADALIKAGYQKVPEGFEWHEVRMHGYLSSGDILVVGPLFESEKAQAREYCQMLGTTPWKPVEDDDK